MLYPMSCLLSTQLEWPYALQDMEYSGSFLSKKPCKFEEITINYFSHSFNRLSFNSNCFKVGLLYETAKKVPDQLLVCKIGDL